MKKLRHPPTAAEKKHMGDVAVLGCIVCLGLGLSSPAEIHHVYYGRMKRDHSRCIGLCAMHHRLGGMGVALHSGKRTFESIYGTEADLLSQVNSLLAEIG
jgi:hypothetical protein